MAVKDELGSLAVWKQDRTDAEKGILFGPIRERRATWSEGGG